MLLLPPNAFQEPQLFTYDMSWQCFLGFADNVLDLRWRDRLWLPLAASLPLLVVYAVDGGGTVIVLPRMLAPLLGTSLQMGFGYYLFMACLAIFCTNSINILAGVNGLEVGQSVVISITVLINNAIQVRCHPGLLTVRGSGDLCAIAAPSRAFWPLCAALCYP